MTSFWSRATHFPPVLVRLVARAGPFGPAMTTDQIARAAGLPPHQVDYISWSIDWAGIDIPTAHRFLTGCAVDFENCRQMKRIYVYLKSRPTWQHLRRSPLWSTFYQPLMRRWRNSVIKTLL